jgi:hypothetical protein
VFWKHVNNLKRNNDFPDVMYLGENTSSNGQDSCNLFASFFKSVYSSESILTSPNGVQDVIHMNTIDLTLSKVFTEISNLPPSFSSGPDGVPPFIIKKCAFTLSIPILKLFKLSLNQGVFPSFWKYSYIQPIFKSGDRQNIENYRGVSLQSAIPKLLDKLVSVHLSSVCNKILVENQHGFRPGRSTITNLVEYLDDLNNTMERGVQTDSIYTDYSKAFDRVNHDMLIAKMKLMGIQDPALSWFNAFLRNRYQCVKINNYLSVPFEVPSGVTQGSHCGPWLFLLFTNDLSAGLTSPHLSFADDLKVYRAINSIQDSEALQKDIDTLAEWSRVNGLHLNPSKCSVITFSKSKNLSRFIYDLNGDELTRTDQVKDLGVILDTELNLKAHINAIVGKAFKQLGFILRQSKDFSPYIIRTLFLTFVRPCVEYGSIVWSPHYATHIKSIEKVQQKFFKSYAFKLGIDISDLEYTERCNLLNLQSLEGRRYQQELVFVYKLVNSLIDAPNLLKLLNFNAPGHTYNTRNFPLFRCPFHRTNYGLNSPMSRMQRRFNDNCDILDLSVSLRSYKNVCYNLYK